MATTTSNYGLVKPDAGEYADISIINENMDKIDQALEDKADSEHAHSYLPLSGGTLNDNAIIKLTVYGATRALTITGNNITADMSKETGGWAGNFSSVIDPAGDTITLLGWYGGASGLNHIFMGGTYSDPYMKMTKAGVFTFKNTIHADISGNANTSTKATADSDGNVISTFYQKKITISTSEPSASDGEDGDIWFVYE